MAWLLQNHVNVGSLSVVLHDIIHRISDSSVCEGRHVHSKRLILCQSKVSPTLTNGSPEMSCLKWMQDDSNSDWLKQHIILSNGMLYTTYCIVTQVESKFPWQWTITLWQISFPIVIVQCHQSIRINERAITTRKEGNGRQLHAPFCYSYLLSCPKTHNSAIQCSTMTKPSQQAGKEESTENTEFHIGLMQYRNTSKQTISM